jgi:hypothetical protein
MQRVVVIPHRRFGTTYWSYFQGLRIQDGLFFNMLHANMLLMFLPMPPHVPYGLRGLPSQLRPKCNLLLRMGRPLGAVTLSRLG